MSNSSWTKTNYDNDNINEELLDYTNLYIKGLWTDCTQEQLEELFKPFGTIIQSRIHGNGVGFVRFELCQQACIALMQLHGTRPHPRSPQALAVKFAHKKTNTKKKRNNKNKSNNNVENSKFVFIGPLPDYYSEELIHQLCSAYGSIISVKLLKKTIAFIHFLTAQAAKACYINLNGKTLHDKDHPLVVKLTKTDPFSSSHSSDNLKPLEKPALHIAPAATPLSTSHHQPLQSVLNTSSNDNKIHTHTTSVTNYINNNNNHINNSNNDNTTINNNNHNNNNLNNINTTNNITNNNNNNNIINSFLLNNTNYTVPIPSIFIPNTIETNSLNIPSQLFNGSNTVIRPTLPLIPNPYYQPASLLPLSLPITSPSSSCTLTPVTPLTLSPSTISTTSIPSSCASISTASLLSTITSLLSSISLSTNNQSINLGFPNDSNFNHLLSCYPNHLTNNYQQIQNLQFSNPSLVALSSLPLSMNNNFQ